MASNYRLGPCQILYKSADLGKTFGGVRVTAAQTTVEIKTDQDGETPVDEFKTGTQIKVAGNLAEITLANFAAQFHTTVTTDGTKQKVEVTPGVGTSLLDQGGVLIIKPYVAGVVTDDANKWITLHNAGMKASMDLGFDATTQQVMAFEAVGYPDSSTGIIATFGDITASS